MDMDGAVVEWNGNVAEFEMIMVRATMLNFTFWSSFHSAFKYLKLMSDSIKRERNSSKVDKGIFLATSKNHEFDD